MWADLLKEEDCYLKSSFPNPAHIIAVLLVLPASNTKLERFLMNAVKTDWRCSLDSRSVEALCRLKVEGPP